MNRTILSISLLALVAFQSESVFALTPIQTNFQEVSSAEKTTNETNINSTNFKKLPTATFKIRQNIFETGQRLTYLLNDSLNHDGVKVGTISLPNDREKDYVIYRDEIYKIPTHCNFRVVAQYHGMKHVNMYLIETCGGKNTTLQALHYSTKPGSFGTFVTSDTQVTDLNEIDLTRYGLSTKQLQNVVGIFLPVVQKKIGEYYFDKYEENLN